MDFHGQRPAGDAPAARRRSGVSDASQGQADPDHGRHRIHRRPARPATPGADHPTFSHRPPVSIKPLGVRELAPALPGGACSAGRRRGGRFPAPRSRSELRGGKRKQAPALQGGAFRKCRSVRLLEKGSGSGAWPATRASSRRSAIGPEPPVKFARIASCFSDRAVFWFSCRCHDCKLCRNSRPLRPGRKPTRTSSATPTSSRRSTASRISTSAAAR
jgi:hypothetical protein